MRIRSGRTMISRRWQRMSVGAFMALAALSAAAEHGLPHAELLGRGTFIDDVSATLKVKGTDGATQVLRRKNASDMVVLRITIQAGGIAPWHTHVGPGTLINLGPGTLTNVGDDCMPRAYIPGDAFVDPGIGEPHAARNDSTEEVVLLAVFYGIEGNPVLPTAGPEECEFLP